MRERPGIGIENYKEMLDKSYYYVDKTLLIKELLDRGGKVSLFTRPRRFGKTLTLSMLRTFFEDERDDLGNRILNDRYFSNQKIARAGEKYTKYMGQFPVIFFSLKSAKQPDFDTAYMCLVEQIAGEYKRHRYLLDSDAIVEEDKKKYQMIMGRKAGYGDYATSLAFLSECLKKYHGKNTVILLDEYDVPLENAFFESFYDSMIDFIRSLLESSLKTNDNLELAVVAGCLRVSKESIFTGLNNFEIVYILNRDYSEYFGFTPQEVDDMLEFYELEEKKAEAKKWYAGYLFGDTEVYNPWSVINYVRTAISDREAFPKPYWSNTSSNSIIKKLVEQADVVAKKEIERLIEWGTIEKPIHEDITYEDIDKTQDNLWNFLFFTGYLKAVSQRFEDDTIYLTLTVPNMEVRYIYRNTIREWFEIKQKQVDYTPFYQALMEGKCTEVEDFITSQLTGKVLSVRNSRQSLLR